ncbi:TetR/AcrR family transcriptional regulator [Streptomyces fulvoviolaceus]|uniref:TetR/AcrR family transcriptional regulator n=1 Tax=Streptomyces fulvoviolaceus TaxID=285535 RepID=UPI0004CAA0FC|nr:TetR/AcrR family transcriptional regulator [Streptomyces fulvoviolaceus]MCT9082589.1 TetR/AcrR family transcriptional regulator [Streptomyces fulvoviolaceus]
MSPKQQRGVATADLLLDAALRVYAEKGEQGLTVSAVTKASGVSLGSLYHHFGSIDGLVEALTLRWMGRMLGDVVTALQRSRTARSGIGALVRAYLDFIQEHRDAALLVHSPAADRKGMADGNQARASQEAPVSAFAAWFQPHIEAGEIAPLPMPLIESLVLGPVIGLARRWLSGIEDVDLDEAARILPERIWRSVSAEPK